MRKRVYLAVFGLMLVLVALLLLGSRPEPRPKCIVEERPLLDWLDEGQLGNSQAATRALKQAGTNALPTLLWMLRQKPSPFKEKLLELAHHQPVFEVGSVSTQERYKEAFNAFLELGPLAKDAVPALMAICQAPVCAEAHSSAALSLASIGSEAKQALPVLLRGATNSSPLVRRDCLLAAVKVHGDPELVVPALTHALQDPDRQVRQGAGLMLSLIGEAAKPATPALVQALTDSDLGVRMEATNALREIDRAAARAAGVNPSAL